MDLPYDFQLVKPPNNGIFQPSQAAGSSNRILDAAAVADEISRQEKERVKKQKDNERSRRNRLKEKEVKANLILENGLLWNQINEQPQYSSIVIAKLQQEIVNLKEQIIEKDAIIELLKG